MYFHIYNKDYPASSGRHIFTILVSLESEINKAINKGHLVKFRLFTFEIQKFKF